MPSDHTSSGDDGYTSVLGEGRLPKFDLRLETIGAIDEANSALGIARALCQSEESARLIVKIQADLYHMMAETSATPENAPRFRKITREKVTWQENAIKQLRAGVEMPGEFILPGDTQASAAIDLARTVVRRAERRMAELLNRGDIENRELLRYLNRLSSLLFVLELKEIRERKAGLTLVKDVENDWNNY